MNGISGRFFLGIDGGGTKTDFLLCTEDGTEINRCTLAGCNPVDIGMERAEEILRKGIISVCEETPYAEISVYAGIAGGITGNNQERICHFLDSFGFGRVRNNSDAMNAVAAALQGQDGVAVIMGTGCVAFTKNGREYLRTGGFGYLIDKGGDGYSIGRDALRYALYAEQRGETDTLLVRLLKEKAGGAILPLLGEIYAKGKAYIASFSPVVFEAMRGGDKTAQHILDTNIAAVGELIREAAEKSDRKNAVPIRMIGGIARQPEVVPWIKMYTEKKTRMKFDIAFSDIEPVVGAVTLAMEDDKNA